MDLKCYPNGSKYDFLRRDNYITRKPIYDFLKNNVRQLSGTILDYGCGNMPYKALFENADKYIGLDVETAKQYGFKDNGVIYYDGKNIPLGDESVDVVMSVQVFEHVEDLEYALKEIYRVLKNDGKLIFTCPMAGVIHFKPYDFRRFTNFGIEKILKNNKFQDIEIKGSNRMIDTVRYMKTRFVFPLLRKPYILLCNLRYIYSISRLYGFYVKIENVVRKLLNKREKDTRLLDFPLDYLVICKK